MEKEIREKKNVIYVKKKKNGGNKYESMRGEIFTPQWSARTLAVPGVAAWTRPCRTWQQKTLKEFELSAVFFFVTVLMTDARIQSLMVFVIFL